MDRLVMELDRMLERREIQEPVVIQAARFDYQPVHATGHAVLPYAELEGMIRAARVVITHGGPGSIMAVLAAGKAPVVVPRDPRYGEHVDDHQVRFCTWFSQRRPIRLVTDVTSLPRVLREVGNRDGVPLYIGPSPEVICQLAEIIQPRRLG
jgi:UDP-N-acetylglucosamine transferase subunit ALG13